MEIDYKNSIRLRKVFKNKLDELGVYDKWFYYTKNTINFIREQDRLEYIRLIQKAINVNRIGIFIINSFDWYETKEGFDYWEDVYRKLKQLE